MSFILFCLCVLCGALARLQAEKLPVKEEPTPFESSSVAEAGFSSRSLLERILWPFSFEEIALFDLQGTFYGQWVRCIQQCEVHPNALKLLPLGCLPLDPFPAGESQDLLSVFTVRLGSPSSSRSVNVCRAAEAVSGTVLLAGDEFSFNHVVGERTPERGFRSGPMYDNGEVIMGIGGGICIVSTALYNLALESNLPILERYPHSGPVSYADPGRDAAVVYKASDLRFRNDTGYPLMIRCLQEKDDLKIALYGSKVPGQQVKILTKDFREIPYKVVVKPDPGLQAGETQQKQTPRAGYEVTTVRVVLVKGKVKRREVISHDRCDPRDAITLIAEEPQPDDIVARNSPLIKRPAFSGPATRDPRGRGERVQED